MNLGLRKLSRKLAIGFDEVADLQKIPKEVVTTLRRS